MVKQDQSNQQDLLERLHEAFVPHEVVVSDTYNPQKAREIFSNISGIVDEFREVNQCYGSVNEDAISYNRINGTLYCKRNIKCGGYSRQGCYERDELPRNYVLHVLGIERERDSIENCIDIVVSLTDKASIPLYIESFYYKTNNRLLYDRLVYQISRELNKELTPYLLKSGSVSPIELKRIMDNVIFSILSMGDKLLKEINLRFKNAS